MYEYGFLGAVSVFLCLKEISLVLWNIYLLNQCKFSLWLAIRVYLLLHRPMQCSFNVIAYKDKPRLRTALEMLNTTQEIERRLEEVCGLCLFCSSYLSYTCHACYIRCRFIVNVLVSTVTPCTFLYVGNPQIAVTVHIQWWSIFSDEGNALFPFMLLSLDGGVLHESMQW